MGRLRLKCIHREYVLVIRPRTSSTTCTRAIVRYSSVQVRPPAIPLIVLAVVQSLGVPKLPLNHLPGLTAAFLCSSCRFGDWPTKLVSQTWWRSVPRSLKWVLCTHGSRAPSRRRSWALLLTSVLPTSKAMHILSDVIGSCVASQLLSFRVPKCCKRWGLKIRQMHDGHGLGCFALCYFVASTTRVLSAIAYCRNRP